ncbi:ATPase family AAA domain-containing protein 2-like [Terrapene carolina triunguis]|uniref:ATPase family AAA domain-containing protein 2-like n=1 Tax=Terrapene triunguis TaxID=2587831 RepID=UPI000E77A06C|nr:ATPase family AAA domain-containing protein 2-like [Terrapene carolina triunguis]
MVDDNGSNWEELLDPILFSLRTNVHATTKMSPFRLMFCADPVLPEEVSENYTIPDMNTFGEDFCKEYSTNMKSRHDADIELALSNISKAQEKQQRHSAERKTSKYGEITFGVGDCVLLLNARKRTRKGGVLEPTYRGPYRITTVEGERVKLQTLSGKRLGAMYSITHLKPFKEPPTLGAESTSEENIGTEIAVGDTDPETPSEESRKMDGTLSHKSHDSTVKNRAVTAMEEEDVSNSDTIDDDDDDDDIDDMLMEDGEDRQWFLKGRV